MLYVRILVSDVGSLHALRDRALALEFEASVTEALRKQPLKAGAEAEAEAERKGRRPAHL